MSPMRLIWRCGALMLTVLVVGCSLQPTQSPAKFLESGNKYAADERFAEAIIEYRNALAADPKLAAAHVALGEAYVKTGDLPKAARELVVAADLLPSDVDAQIKAGHMLFLAGRFEDARTRADRALALDGKNVTAQILKGNSTAGLKDIAGAIADINEAIALDPKDASGYASLGALELTKGRRDEAEAAFKRAVEVDSASAAAQMALANYYLSSGRLAEAEAPLERAVELDPTSVMAQQALAVFYEIANRSAEAEGPLKAIAESKKDVASKLALADYYVLVERTTDAIALLKTIAAEPDGRIEASLRLATIDYAQNRRREAHQTVDMVLAKQPRHTQALLLKARFLLAERSVDQALALAQSAVAADPQSAPAHDLVGSIFANMNRIDEAIASFAQVLKINPRIGSAALRLADLELRQGSAPAALTHAEQAVQQAPQGIGTRLVLARTLLANNQPASAEGIVRELLVAQPEAAEIHVQLGDILLAKGDRTRARQSYDRAAALAPNSTLVLRGRVGFAMDSGDIATARTVVERGVEAAPTDAQRWLLAARVYGSAGDLAKQEAALKKVVELDSSSLVAFAALAGIYTRTGRLDQAKSEYEALQKREPKSQAASTMIAIILEAQRKPDEAQKVYERIVAAWPASPIAANNLAWLYAEREGNLDVALELAQSATSQLPDVAGVNDTLGWVYYKKDLAQLAIRAFETGASLDPKSAVYRYHLGLAYMKTGDMTSAAKALDEALRLRPDYAEAREARAKLADIGS